MIHLNWFLRRLQLTAWSTTNSSWPKWPTSFRHSLSDNYLSLDWINRLISSMYTWNWFMALNIWNRFAAEYIWELGPIFLHTLDAFIGEVPIWNCGCGFKNESSEAANIFWRDQKAIFAISVTIEILEKTKKPAHIHKIKNAKCYHKKSQTKQLANRSNWLLNYIF